LTTCGGAEFGGWYSSSPSDMDSDAASEWSAATAGCTAAGAATATTGLRAGGGAAAPVGSCARGCRRAADCAAPAERQQRRPLLPGRGQRPAAALLQEAGPLPLLLTAAPPALAPRTAPQDSCQAQGALPSLLRLLPSVSTQTLQGLDTLAEAAMRPGAAPLCWWWQLHHPGNLTMLAQPGIATGTAELARVQTEAALVDLTAAAAAAAAGLPWPLPRACC